DQNNYFGYKRYGVQTPKPWDISFRLVKKVDSLITDFANFGQNEPKGIWQILKISTYEAEHSFFHSYFGKFDFTTEDLNIDGLIRFQDRADYDLPFYLDYLYIRKNTKPMPIVSVKK
ncbi:hypothetical protein GW896_01200, partial [Candidatus Kuenenbacteria bacterium]|nr:hypothetical protein [Candidatus Kuenenbacteria bacterium]